MSNKRGSSKIGNWRFSTSLAACAAILLVIAAPGAGGLQAATEPSAAASEPAIAGGPPTFRRLSEDQYKRAIAQIFGEDIPVPGRFEPPVREDGLLAIGSSKVVVTTGGLEQYAIRAREISARVLDDAHRKQFLQCEPQTPTAFDDACARQFLGKYGRLLFRRPLTEKEMTSALTLSRQASEKVGNFHKGVAAGLASLLVSPSFIFRMDTTEPDPNLKGARRLDDYSLATRISFLLWDAPPDEELLDAAANGMLRTKDGLDRQVDRLMASPRLEQGVRAFFADMFAYDQFDGLSKDMTIYPIFNPRLRDDAEEQSLRTIVDHLLTQKKDYRDLFTTRQTFLSRSLGALYGVKVDYRAFDGWMPYTIPADAPYAGLLTLPAFLMLDPSHEGRSSPTIRGKSVRELLLCQPVPMPPGNVDFSAVQDINNQIHKTARDRLTVHNENPVCRGCHAITDPIGLAIENYDAVGKFRTQENGALIDASGSLGDKTFKGAIGLQQALRESPDTTSCVAQRVYEYGVGRKPTSSEEKWLESVNQRFGQDGYRFPALLRQIATSATFQTVASEAIALNLK